MSNGKSASGRIEARTTPAHEGMRGDTAPIGQLGFEIPRCKQGFDVTGTGFTVLDRILVDGEHLRDSLGGSCGNVLITLAMLGRRVAPILSLGDDAVGERLTDDFARAGADIGCIRRREEGRTPVLIHEVETAAGTHSFRWPEGDIGQARYVPIDAPDVAAARSTISRGAVFYADRLSGTILEAMEIAWEAGSIVFFEPSEFHEEGLLRPALAMTSILKCSSERMGERMPDAGFDGVRILTRGADGLTLDDGIREISCPAYEAPRAIDACGAGDLISIAVIDHLIARDRVTDALRTADILDGVRAGQRLAAENCRYPGARGLLEACGADYLARVLRGGLDPA